MKLTFLIVLVALLIAAVGASSATAQRAPCSQKSGCGRCPRLSSAGQLYVHERCGRRVGLPFG